MKPYQLTYIIASETSPESLDGTQKDIETFVQDAGGLIIKSEKTAPQMLAYPVKKRHSAYFFTLDFQAPEDIIKKIKEKIEKTAGVLRHVIVVKKPVKQKKQRRAKRPPAQEVKATRADAKLTTETQKVKPAHPVQLEDIDKKLDEILSE